jgi:hypothetical protein
MRGLASQTGTAQTAPDNSKQNKVQTPTADNQPNSQSDQLHLERIEKGQIHPSYIISNRITLDPAPEMYKVWRDKKEDVTRRWSILGQTSLLRRPGLILAATRIWICMVPDTPHNQS